MEGLVRRGGKLENLMKTQHDTLKSIFHWKRRSSHSDDKVDSSPAAASSASPSPIPQLSPLANSVVARCSKILNIPTEKLQHDYDIELPESVKQLLTYARNFLEFCSYQALCTLTKQPDYLKDKEFRRLTYDMMLAWEAPSIETEVGHKETAACGKSDEDGEDASSLFYKSATNLAVQVDDTKTVCRDAFARIAPVCGAITDIVTVYNLFDALTSTSDHRLHFLIYDKYLRSLYKIIKSARHVPGQLVSNLHLAEGEIVLDVDGTIPTQPVLQHIGILAWPGRLTLTNHALYFEPLGVGLYDKAVRYDLASDAKQVLKAELIGPLGARLFDRAILYSSASLSEPVYFEFLEFKGNSRRDYWLDISLEILHAHRFVRKNEFDGIQRTEVLAGTTLCVLRYRAIREAFRFFSSNHRTLLAFKLAKCLPRGYKILEIFAKHISLRGVTTNQQENNGSSTARPPSKHFPVALLTLRQLGFPLEKEAVVHGEATILGHLSAGETNAMERAVQQSIMDLGRAEAAQATVDKVKVDGIDTNVAVMKELLFPVTEFASHLQYLFLWEDPLKSSLFVASSCYAILMGWAQYTVPFLFTTCAVSMFYRKHFNRRKPIGTFRVKAPPNKNPVEQLMTLQEAISQLEALIQASNIALLKIRAILFAVLPQATEKVALFLVTLAAVLAFVPTRVIVLLVFAELFTRQMPCRKESSERLLRELRDWWVEVPAAPVQLVKKEETTTKKKKH